MNRHARRAQQAQGKTETETWRRGIETVHREAAGVLDLIIVRPEEILLLSLSRMSGDQRANATAIAVTDAICGINEAAKTSAPKLCGSCPRELTDNCYAVVVAMPQRDAPSAAIVMAICHGCATTEAGIREKATEAFRSVWPDLRPITVTHQDGGRA
jgi:hypothetical protein